MKKEGQKQATYEYPPEMTEMVNYFKQFAIDQKAKFSKTRKKK